MKKLNRWLFATIGFLLPWVVAAQTSITGTVVDARTQSAIIGAAISIKTEQGGGTTTDLDGHFSLETKEELPVTLVVSYIGYDNFEMDIFEAESPLFIELNENTFKLNEVVVVGYGTQKRENLSTSVASLGQNSLKDMATQSFESVLAGKASGVSLTTPSGAVGTAPIVRVRGVNSITSGTQPLYVIDGIPMIAGNQSYGGDSNALADINPADIVRIDILKDASAAALYGSRAANGVILITTRQGEQGKTQVNYQGYVGISQVVDYYDLMNAEQFVEYKNQAYYNRYGVWGPEGTAHTEYGTNAFNLMYDAEGHVVDTDWADEILQTGIQQSHTVSVSGGNDKITYYFSGNYFDQTGIYRGDEYNRLQAVANVQAQVTPWLKVGGKVSLTDSKQATFDRARQGGYFSREGLTRIAIALNPNFPTHYPDGSPWSEDGQSGYGPNRVSQGLSNPYTMFDSNSAIRNNSLRALYNFSAELKPIKNLTLRTQYGKDLLRLEDRTFDSAITDDGFSDHGRAINTSTQVQQYTWTNTVQYDGTLAEKHHFSLLAGTEVFEKKLTRWGAMRTDLLDQDYSIYEAAYNNAYATGNRITENGLLSYLVRINYDWDSRYILSLNGRRDGFSALSRNHRWGNFGGVSAAWTLSEEPFFEPLRKKISHLKLRAGWGVVGNTNVGDYAAYSYYLNSYYGDSGAYTIGQVADSENLKWESSRKLDVGVEATLFDKLDVELGYYDTRSSDLILAVPVSPSKGIPGNSITTNAGAVKNNGIELNLSMDLISRKNFTWHTSLDFSTNHNVVTSLGNAESLMDANAPCATNITVVGQSVGQLYLYHAGGVDPETGRRILYGKNGEEVLLMFEKQGQFFTRDGKLFSQSDLEKHVCGNVLPTWFGGWNHDFRWRQFDLNLFFQFSGGNKIFNGTKGTLADGRFWNNAEEVYYDHWTEENRYATYAKPIYGDTYSNSGSSFPLDIWVERGDFLRLKNLTLGYSVPEKSRWLATVGVKKIRVYAQAQNLFVLTGYSGIDPEVTSNTNSYTLSGGTDYQTTPQSRTFLFGVNVSF
ncbi:MAG: SusC/RagA family TonB-linked outer membrane protein [Parabacteroides sp.]